jgi:flagellar biosynthesis protein FliP
MRLRRYFAIIVFLFGMMPAAVPVVYAQSALTTEESAAISPTSSFGRFEMSMDLGDGSKALAPALRIALLLFILTLLPAIVISVTSFTRIVIVLGFLRQALGTQSLPPNQVLMGLSIFLCLFTMSPVINQIKEQAWDPFQAEEITDFQAMERAVQPIRLFMAKHTRPEDLRFFVSQTGQGAPNSFSDIDTLTLVPSFMLSELRTAFIMGAMLYIPFVIIDMIVAATLMSMGMMMVPPVMVSLPVKILLFVVADGWNLVVGSLVRSFT